jgi:GT2 family glycosyltransferase
LVSLVILSWNRREDVRESLSRIKSGTWANIEIIVCDNGSADSTPEMVKREFPEVILIEFAKNIGIEAYNAGFRRARGEYIVILDDDSFPAPLAVERMVSKFEADPSLGIVAFDVRNYYSYDEVTKEQVKSRTATAEGYILGFNGAGAGIRKAVFEEVGYYPGEFFLYWNEQDLSLRAFDAGWKVVWFPDVISYHKYSPRNRASWRAPFYYCRNAFWLVWKNYPLKECIVLTIKLGVLVVRHTFEQRTTVYLKALLAAVKGGNAILLLRKPVKPEIAKRFRAPVELSFTFYG